MSVDPAVQQETEGATDAGNRQAGTAQAATGEAANGAAANGAAANGAAANEAGAGEAGEAPRKRGRPRKEAAGARKTRSVELVLTVTGTADGEWQADLKHGTQRVVQGVSIPAAAVSRAAKELHEDISEGIEQVIGAAREQHRSRLEELEAEMAKVKQALAELED